MAFNLGALAGGLSEGLESGANINNKNLAAGLSKDQLMQLRAQHAGQQAFMNTLIPGATPTPNPEISGIDNMKMPAMSQMPVIGDIGRAAGIWAQPPEPAGGMPMPGRNPMGTGGGAAPSPAPQPMPQQQPGIAVRQEGNQPPIESHPGMMANMSPQAIAAAIDKANPGLRQRDPAAFAHAVEFGMQQVAAITQQGQQSQLNQAQVGHLNAQSEMERAHGQYYGGRAQVAAQGNKFLLEAYKQNEATLRNLQSQKSRIASAFDIRPPEKKQMLDGLTQQIQQLEQKRESMAAQMRGDQPTQSQPQAGQGAQTDPDMIQRYKDAKAYDKASGIISNNLKIGDHTKLYDIVKRMGAAGVPNEVIKEMVNEAAMAAGMSEEDAVKMLLKGKQAAGG